MADLQSLMLYYILIIVSLALSHASQRTKSVSQLQRPTAAGYSKGTYNLI